jgi:hypothetical protein
MKGMAIVFPYALGNTVAIPMFPQIYGFCYGGFFVTFLIFSLNEGNRTPYRKSVASALILFSINSIF